MIRFYCPHCGLAHEATPKVAGSHARCSCGRVFQIPDPGGTIPPPDTPPTPVRGDSRAAVVGTPSRRPTIPPTSPGERVRRTGRLPFLGVAPLLLLGGLMAISLPPYNVVGLGILGCCAFFPAALAAWNGHRNLTSICAANLALVVVGFLGVAAQESFIVLGATTMLGVLTRWVMRAGDGRPPRPGG